MVYDVYVCVWHLFTNITAFYHHWWHLPKQIQYIHQTCPILMTYPREKTEAVKTCVIRFIASVCTLYIPKLNINNIILVSMPKQKRFSMLYLRLLHNFPEKIADTFQQSQK